MRMMVNSAFLSDAGATKTGKGNATVVPPVGNKANGIPHWIPTGGIMRTARILAFRISHFKVNLG